MKRFIGLVFLIVMVSLAVETVWADDTEREPKGNTDTSVEMTLADAVSLALRSNRSIAITYLNRVIEKYDLRIAEAEFLPNIRVDVSAGGTYTDSYVKVTGDKSTPVSYTHLRAHET